MLVIFVLAYLTQWYAERISKTHKTS